ncbi:bifunctional phosphoribosylaminoimidazolecarboxamide formyltransferase/IMP cyclohydrolase [bacterium]|nr:bifunctional phosphoribosylaminoimidazolecarboxamide formyltransferase/IMP cyclohydrolase [bacterium]MBU1071769.1 bifunctional phosphoribosylaminoimidazolecarboxamide formyltransferase/IMP cyclohydrolase [bacterium]
MARDPEMKRPRRVLFSVTDKTGLSDLAVALQALGYEFLASGGTAAYLRDHGFPVTGVSDVTGFPEIFGGRVKTLHPRIFGGILGASESDFAAVAESGVAPIDVVVCNLYDFASAVASGADHVDVIEKIDIGGPSLLRAAAKNHARVCALCDPADYEAFILACRAGDGFPDAEFRRRMAAETFALVTDYDAQIADYFAGDIHEGHLGVQLRYGENPHQQAELFLPGDDPDDPLAGLGMRQCNGKTLSYNNLVDVIAAAKLIGDLEGVCCAAVKHTNPCGVGAGPSPALALQRALRCDPESAFGGVFAFTSEVDDDAAEILRRRFCEVVLAPSFTSGALAALQKKKNLRVLTCDLDIFTAATRGQGRAFGQVQLHQEEDEGFPELREWRHVAGPAPDEHRRDALSLNWRVCKHVKSNAIVLGDHEGTLGIGAGQMSRVDSTRLAIRKAGDQELELRGCVCASDAFFPFADSIEHLHAAGVAGVIAPGGSIRDEEVIAAAERLGVTLIHTNRRHFRH